MLVDLAACASAEAREPSALVGAATRCRLGPEPRPTQCELSRKRGRDPDMANEARWPDYGRELPSWSMGKQRGRRWTPRLRGADLHGANLSRDEPLRAELHGGQPSRGRPPRCDPPRCDPRHKHNPRHDLGMLEVYPCGELSRGEPLRSGPSRGEPLQLHKCTPLPTRTRASLSSIYLIAAPSTGRTSGWEAILFDTIFANVDLSTAKGLDTSAAVRDRASSIAPQPVGPLALGLIARLRPARPAEIDYPPSLLDEAIQYLSSSSVTRRRTMRSPNRLYADLQNKGVRCWFAPRWMSSDDGVDEAPHGHANRLLLILSGDSVCERMRRKWRLLCEKEASKNIHLASRSA